MAQPQLLGSGIDLNFTYRTKATGSANVNPITTLANYADPVAIDARLTAINSTYYTAAVLNKMLLNDKIYAIRVADDAATL